MHIKNKKQDKDKIILYMRSLYTDDISGTRSKPTIYQKSLFKEKYDRFAKSNEKNPQHKKYEWYVPPKKQRNQSVDFQPRYTLKLMSEHTGMSKSGHFEQFKKVCEQNLTKSRRQNQSVLSHSGRHSIAQINVKKDVDNSPYFPHKYQDSIEHRIKWSGNKNWNYDQPDKLTLPNVTKSKLFAYI